ncbi:hypothetical protein QTI24_29565 [Variovorax sp. J22P240]|uniref:hypothetical protein n=1 Tax=Variovorax sp. J22P240 TaxID=3053514 RepID=UPI002578C882|nr:hypothetical protein [Variovorax sp. J22P240]MDM0002776.1 hypothetical protein [Variovorax sp. J22P240]
MYNLLEDIGDAREEQRKAGLPSSVVLKKLDRAVNEFATYVDNNADAIVNYGERYRCGERISTGFVESAVNQVISKQFVKKQQCAGRRAERIFCSMFVYRSSTTSYAESVRFGGVSCR